MIHQDEEQGIAAGDGKPSDREQIEALKKWAKQLQADHEALGKKMVKTQHQANEFLEDKQTDGTQAGTQRP